MGGEREQGEGKDKHRNAAARDRIDEAELGSRIGVREQCEVDELERGRAERVGPGITVRVNELGQPRLSHLPLRILLAMLLVTICAVCARSF